MYMYKAYLKKKQLVSSHEYCLIVKHLKKNQKKKDKTQPNDLQNTRSVHIHRIRQL
jgi:hypothetical protein